MNSFACYLVSKDSRGVVSAAMSQQSSEHLPSGEVLIEVEYSSLNYKDALAATGHPGVVRQFPHVPGIDAAGIVLESDSVDFEPGQRVLVTGHDLGAGQWGGWSQRVRVPAHWAIAVPDGLSTRETMLYGTAGLTAAMSVASLQLHGVDPDRGDVIVTGATGGVGIISVMLLSRLGYQVVAVSGKVDQHSRLQKLGAHRVISREDVDDSSGKPLLKAHWAGAIDTVGGNTLATLIKSTKNGGCVAACGLVGGSDFGTTVYPFLLRGVTLAGIDSAWFPRDQRESLWQKLANPWSLDLGPVSSEIELPDVGESVDRILAGQNTGRTVIGIPDKTS